MKDTNKFAICEKYNYLLIEKADFDKYCKKCRYLRWVFSIATNKCPKFERKYNEKL